jgi:hypothetical protein
MVSSVTPIHNGFACQARHFWLQALDLLDEESPVWKVTFEAAEPKGFDDFVIEFKPAKVTSATLSVETECHQIKWQTAGSTFGWADLMEPKFINAQSSSLLQNLKAACDKDGAKSCQFVFNTTASIETSDPLFSLLSKDDDRFLLQCVPVLPPVPGCCQSR